MNTDRNPTIHLPIREGSFDRVAVVNRFPLFPLVSSSTVFTLPPLPWLATSQGEDRTRSPTPKKASSVKCEPRDEEYEGYRGTSPGPTPPPTKPRTSDGKRKRAKAPTKRATPRKRGRERPSSSADSNPSPSPSPLPAEKNQLLKNEPNEEDESEDDQQGGNAKRELSTWAKEELDLVHELCKKNKTGGEIWLELQNKLGSTKSQMSVANCRRKVKILQVEWLSEDVEYLLQAAKDFDRYKAIAYEFNKLSGRTAKGEAFGKGIIEFKLKSLEMETKRSLEK